MVGVLVLAIKYKYKNVALAAFRATFRLPISDLRPPPELSSIGLDTYEALIRYHTSCGAAASAVTLRREWFPLKSNLISMGPVDMNKYLCPRAMRDFVHGPPPYDLFSSSTRFASRYLWSYLHRSAVILSHQPGAEAVMGKDFVLKYMDCLDCFLCMI